MLPLRRFATILLAGLFAGPLLFGQQQETYVTRLLKSSEADQIAYLNDYIAEGITTPTEGTESLVMSKTSLFVPMLEEKIEEIVHLRPQERWFKNPSVNPERVVVLLAMMIEYTGQEVALQQASKLMKIDEDRFGPIVERCLTYAFSHEKGFQLAYRGLKIGDPAVDKRIMIWAEGLVGAGGEPNRTIILRQWAQAMVEEYNGTPDEYQWAKDPIVSRLSADRLNPVGEPLHDEMFRLIAESAAKRRSSK